MFVPDDLVPGRCGGHEPDTAWQKRVVEWNEHKVTTSGLLSGQLRTGDGTNPRLTLDRERYNTKILVAFFILILSFSCSSEYNHTPLTTPHYTNHTSAGPPIIPPRPPRQSDSMGSLPEVTGVVPSMSVNPYAPLPSTPPSAPAPERGAFYHSILFIFCGKFSWYSIMIMRGNWNGTMCYSSVTVTLSLYWKFILNRPSWAWFYYFILFILSYWSRKLSDIYTVICVRVDVFVDIRRAAGGVD